MTNEQKQVTEASVLWNRFLMLTEEMDKFLKKEDVDMFLTLLEQRVALQKALEELNDQVYCKSPEGKELIGKIMNISVNLQYEAQVWLNKAKRSRNGARAYESLGYGQNLSGFQFNRKF